MSETPAHDDRHGRGAGFVVGAVAVVVAAVAVVGWLVLRDNGSPQEATTTTSVAEGPLPAKAITPAGLEAFAASIGHPVFWVGPQAGVTYELSRAANGSNYVRYLPKGADVGTKTQYLTVATYPYTGAYAAIQAVTKQQGATAIELADGGLAETSPKTPTSVHAAYPNVPFQIEVYDPAKGKAEQLVRAGKLAAIGGLKSSGSGAVVAIRPTAMTPRQLRKRVADLGRPVYWAGERDGGTVELVRTATDQLFVRYLPDGKKAGDQGQYLTIGTYPYQGAFEALQSLAKDNKDSVIGLKGGGIAVVDARGTNIHLAFPGVDYQIEVFDPSAAAAKKVVTSGQVQPVG